MKLPEVLPHQIGESLEPQKKQNYLLSEESKLAVDTYGGRVHVEWDPQSSVTPLKTTSIFY